MLRDALMRALNLVCGDFARVPVVVDEHDAPVMSFPAKRTIEMYMLCERNWETPRVRLFAMEIGHEEMRKWLAAHGWSDANCWLPPAIERAFGKRLHFVFGWIKSTWNSYSRMTAGER